MKARRPDNVVRKLPRQARAQATVGAILEATVQILDREGLDAATMARIAEVAGVSVGSIYQYFPHRDAILHALQDREFERALKLIQELLADGNLTQTPEQTVTTVVRGLALLYRSCPGLHRVLAIEGLRVTKADRVHAFDLRVIEIVRHFLRATSAPTRAKSIDAAAFVVFQSVRATMLAWMLERPPGLDEETLIREVVDLVLCYLVPQARGENRDSATGAAR
ncbi:MAG TPA: TetR/AcrR family transcriptional regulator [Polyangiaceae bacterium]|jgi:AcrR family transcriptional regulator|nr:TetR/AcrR family transcriptional regulator [Polyangiaceae bacterium]